MEKHSVPFFIFLEYFFRKVYKIQSYGHTYNVRKINQKNKGEIKMEIGTILVNRWGYDQTNVDFFQVIKVTEKTVVIRQIAKEKVKE